MIPDDQTVELSYWEGLRAYWRIYWPTQVAAAALLFLAGVLRLRVDPLGMTALQAVIGAVALYLLVPRVYSRPYRGFSLVIVDPLGGRQAHRLDARQRGVVWWFLWWRQLVAGLIAGFLAWPTNIVLSLMGVHLAGWIAAIGGVLVIGPILMKMLIGNPFDTFRIEAWHERKSTVIPPAPPPSD